MSSGISFLDTYSPNLDGKTEEQKIQTLANYIHQLGEQLRYTFVNLGPENFNETSLQEMLAPLVARIEALEARVSALEGE